MKYLEVSHLNIEELNNYQIPSEVLKSIRYLCSVIPFKTNNYILTQLINWSNWKECGIFKMNFPQVAYYTHTVNNSLHNDSVHSYPVPSTKTLINSQTDFRQEHLVFKLPNGCIHHFPSTLMLYPAEAQNCFGICTYCYRWALHFSKKNFYYSEPLLPARYLEDNPEISDVLITGGDALFMRGTDLKKYVVPLLAVKSLKTIRLATRALSWWPYRFISDIDTSEIFELFHLIKSAEKSCTIMAHISHPDEIATTVAKQAIEKIRAEGIVIRSQTPMLRGVNDSPEILRNLLDREVTMGIVPYYLFIESSTGLTNHFKLPLTDAFEIYSNAINSISGLARTLRGPVITANAKKILIDGFTEFSGEKKMVLKCIQSPVLHEVGLIKLKDYDQKCCFVEWD